MFNKTTDMKMHVNLDALASLIQSTKACYAPRSSDLDRCDSLQILSRNISEILKLVPNGGTGDRLQHQNELALDVMNLIATALARKPGVPISLDDLDRPALLLVLCQTILSCLAVAETQEMDLPAALDRCSRHLSRSGTYNAVQQSRFRRLMISLPDGKQSLADLV